MIDRIARRTPLLSAPQLPGVSVWVVTTMVIVLALGWLGLNARVEFNRVVEQEYRLLEVGARQREARLSGALRSVDLMLQNIAEDWVAAASPKTLVTDAVLRDRMRQLPEVRSLLIVDAAGRVVVSTLESTIGLEVADREYFKTHADATQDATGLHVSRPFITRTTELHVVAGSRALRDPDGRFLGAIVATIDPGLFDEILRLDEGDAGDQAVLINRHGDIIGIVPEQAIRFRGRSLQGGAAFTEHLAARRPLTRHLARARLEPVTRASVYLDLPGTDLIVVLARDHNAVLAAWLRSEWHEIAAFAAAAGVALLLAALAIRRQRSLERANAFSLSLIETANVMVVGLDHQGRVCIFNAAAEQMTGHPRDEILGQDWFDRVVPKDRFPQAWDAFTRISAAAETGSHFETPILTRRGEIRHIAWQNTRLDDRAQAVALLSFGRDITVQKAEAEALMNSRAEIERLSNWKDLLLNSAGEGIYGVDRDGRCTFINPAALELLGLTENEVIGQDQHALFHVHHADGSPYRVADCPVQMTLQDGIARRVEDHFLRKSGEFFPVQLSVTPIIEAGSQVGAEAVFQDISQRKQMEAELRRLATTDPLTGLANRRRFVGAMEQEIERIRRFPGTEAALLMFDLDHFKRINDNFGHAAGDQVLKEFARRLQERLRKIDLAGRLGGEEFAVLLPGTGYGGACTLAGRLLREAAGAPMTIEGRELTVTVSIGVASLSASDETPDATLHRADMALYAAKAEGRNRVVCSESRAHAAPVASM